MEHSRIDLGSDPVWKIFTRYAVPSVFGMLAMSTAQIVDGVFIGRFVGPEGLAAINLVWPLVMIFSGISMMIATGGATLANISRGSGDYPGADRRYSVTMVMLTAFGIAAVAISLIFAKAVPAVLGAGQDIADLIIEYISIIMLFAPFFMLTFAQDLFIRADGRPVFPVACMMGGYAANIILDYLFVGIMGMGIGGAAWATGISQFIPFTLMVFYLSKKTRWKLVKPVFSLAETAHMLYNGLSEFVDEISIGTSLYIFNFVLVRRIGAMGVAAYSIAGYIGEICGIIFFSTAQAIHPGVSFNKGAGKMKRVRSLRNAAFLSNACVGLLTFLILQLFSGRIASIFVTDSSVMALASEISFYYSFSLIPAGINIAAAMFFTAMDKPAQSALIAFSRSLVMLITGLVLLPVFLGNTGIWLSFLFAEAVTSVIMIIMFRLEARKKTL